METPELSGAYNSFSASLARSESLNESAIPERIEFYAYPFSPWRR